MLQNELFSKLLKLQNRVSMSVALLFVVMFGDGTWSRSRHFWNITLASI